MQTKKHFLYVCFSVFKSIFQYVTGALLLHALICKLSLFFYQKVENGLIEDLVSNAMEKSVNHFCHHLKNANIYYATQQLFEFLSLFCFRLNYKLIDAYLQGEFKMYGLESLAYFFGFDFEQNPRCKVFPTNGQCKVPSSDAFADLIPNSGLCTLNQNSWNQFFYTVIWLWFALTVTLAFLSLILRVISLMSLKFRTFILLGKLLLQGMLFKKKVICYVIHYSLS